MADVEADVQIETLAAALEREHREIDGGIAEYTATVRGENPHREPLLRAIRALRRHIYLEEAFLFPLLREAEAGLTAPVFVMLREHGQLWQTLDSIEHEPDPSADVARCHELTVQLLHHNLKEEKVLYPLTDEVLTDAAAERLRMFLASGKMPDGWVCAKAGISRG